MLGGKPQAKVHEARLRKQSQPKALPMSNCAFPSAAADHAVPLTIVLLLPFTNMWYEIISEKATDCCLPVAGIVSQLQE